MRELFLIATGQDTAGWNWRIHDSFRRHATTWLTRSMAATQTFLEYPEDLTYRAPLRDALYRRADAIHLQNQIAGWSLYDQGMGKPTVLQHHGTIFRETHAALSAQARKIGMVEICSTLDLTLYEPNVEWVPIPYRGDDLLAIRQEVYRPSDTIRIAHAPTNRAVKGTDHFLTVMEQIGEEMDVKIILIEHQSWADCLRAKAEADIFYDQLELGYGCNAIEAWAMGIPVIAGVADPVVRQVMIDRWGRLPFAEATPETLRDVVMKLIASRRSRDEYAAIGREHFDAWHDEAVLVPQMEQIYSSARGTQPGPRSPRKFRR